MYETSEPLHTKLFCVPFHRLLSLCIIHEQLVFIFDALSWPIRPHLVSTHISAWPTALACISYCYIFKKALSCCLSCLPSHLGVLPVNICRTTPLSIVKSLLCHDTYKKTDPQPPKSLAAGVLKPLPINTASLFPCTPPSACLHLLSLL